MRERREAREDREGRPHRCGERCRRMAKDSIISPYRVGITDGRRLLRLAAPNRKSRLRSSNFSLGINQLK